MRSPAERARRLAEHAFRVGSVVLLAWMVWVLLRPRERAETSVVTSERTLGAHLREWTLGPAPTRAHAVLDSAADAGTRHWLAALRRAGMGVTWSAISGGLPALALEAEPIAEPRGGARVLVAAPNDAIIALRDDLGPLDSARAERGGASFALPRLDGMAHASLNAHMARATLADALRLGSVVVIGRASWETRFIAEALEERGWRVELRQLLAPGIESARGRGSALDTSGIAAVIAADSSAARDAPRIAAFVRSGGGLVLLADAPRAPALAALAPGRAGTPVRPSQLAFAADAPRRALVVRPITALREDAVVLERGAAGVVAAGRRVANGRVVLLGYEDSWRWRLSGGSEAPAAHRDWWSRVVASVAYRGERAIDRAQRGDAAPLAAMVDALGAPSGEPPRAGAGGASRALPVWMLVLLLSLLLAEWASRRLRGAR